MRQRIQDLALGHQATHSHSCADDNVICGWAVDRVTLEILPLTINFRQCILVISVTSASGFNQPSWMNTKFKNIQTYQNCTTGTGTSTGSALVMGIYCGPSNVGETAATHAKVLTVCLSKYSTPYTEKAATNCIKANIF
ncbi:hypothetical protein CHS0354_007587 [Potamilus streckersoni]|uniref:Uncharacterized protein n=1 Tax=Potamilus streckersoni TaxID=2493646 RepID=A0AAE0W7P1_9BIVA|nr:hypothetical protein CHS0354_007587 [Potamilus streckersoni]